MIATNDSIFRGTRGKFGNLVARMVNGKTIISRLPEPGSPQTAVQKNNRAQFREASAFAKAAMLDPEIKAYFQQEANKRKLPNAYTAALSFKLKDLKTSARQKDQTPPAKEVAGVSPGTQQKSSYVMPSAGVNQFSHIYSVLDPLEAALGRVYKVWQNVEGMTIDKTQKEVVQTALRLRIQDTLCGIHMNSKANAMEFKHPMPNLEHITALVTKDVP